jgi:hypothetical protein
MANRARQWLPVIFLGSALLLQWLPVAVANA